MIPRWTSLRQWIEAGACRPVREPTRWKSCAAYSPMPNSAWTRTARTLCAPAISPASPCCRTMRRAGELPACRDPDDQKFLEIAGACRRGHPDHPRQGPAAPGTPPAGPRALRHPHARTHCSTNLPARPQPRTEPLAHARPRRNSISQRSPRAARLPYHDTISPSTSSAGRRASASTSGRVRRTEAIGLGRQQHARHTGQPGRLPVEGGIARRHRSRRPPPRAGCASRPRRAWRRCRCRARPSSRARAR